MKANKVKVNFRYHNPNTDEETLIFVAKLFIEASRVKFEKVLRETAAQENHRNDAERTLAI